jgi:hypothetical protein
MHIFSFGKKRIKKAKRQPTSEQMSRNAELRRQRYIAESYIEMAKQDPKFRQQMIVDEYKLKLPIKDPVVEQQKEIEALLSALVIKELKDNPELAKRVVDTRIAQLTTQEDSIPHGGDQDYPPDTAVGQVLAEMEDLEELKSRLGGGKSSAWSDILKDPQVVTGLIATFQSIIKGSSPPVTEAVVMVDIDGQPTTVTETEFQRLQMEGRVRPVAAIESTKTSRKLGVDKISSGLTTQTATNETFDGKIAGQPETESSDEPQLPLIFQLVGMTKLSGYLKKIPTIVVEQLEKQKLTDPSVYLLWNYLETVDLGSLTQALVAYENNGELGSYVRQLLSDEGKIWLSEVIELIKQRANNIGSTR